MRIRKRSGSKVLRMGLPLVETAGGMLKQFKGRKNEVGFEQIFLLNGQIVLPNRCLR